ncbi:sugar phosphate nucleotidyltransferase, partial [Salmonella enterica]|uniref:sugar phosphate nucleotidyltransferase n=1 Tax=Salmonella enterica TaxID=28901 RepID=UPI0020C35B65
DQEKFVEAIEQSLKAASENDCLITLGIKPSRPDTGYGYIQYVDNSLPTDPKMHKVKLFTEKPNLELAKSFIQSGDFLWNAG